MKAICISISLFLSVAAYCQVEITSSTNTLNQKAELEVISPNQNTGVLIPRMTSAQIQAIPSPSNGVLAYDTDLNAFVYNAAPSGSKLWVQVGQIPAVSALPAVGKEGMIYYNATDKKTYFYNGTGWVALTY